MEQCSGISSSGPPFYASRCLMMAGHNGNCYFGDPAEARVEFERSLLGKQRAIEETLLREALTLIKSHAGGWVEPVGRNELSTRRSIDLNRVVEIILAVAHDHGMLMNEKAG